MESTICCIMQVEEETTGPTPFNVGGMPRPSQGFSILEYYRNVVLANWKKNWYWDNDKENRSNPPSSLFGIDPNFPAR